VTIQTRDHRLLTTCSIGRSMILDNLCVQRPLTKLYWVLYLCIQFQTDKKGRLVTFGNDIAFCNDPIHLLIIIYIIITQTKAKSVDTCSSHGNSTSLLIREIQIEEISKLGWVMVFHKHTIRLYCVCLIVDIARFTHRDGSNCQKQKIPTRRI